MEPPPATFSIGTARRAQRNWPVQANVDAPPPIVRCDLVDAASGAGDAGVIDQGVEAAEGVLGFGKEGVDLGLVGDIGPNRCHHAGAPAGGVEGPVGDVADDDPRAERRQRLGDAEPDPASAGGDEHPLAGKAAQEVLGRGRWLVAHQCTLAVVELFTPHAG